MRSAAPRLARAPRRLDREPRTAQLETYSWARLYSQSLHADEEEEKRQELLDELREIRRRLDELTPRAAGEAAGAAQPGGEGDAR